jgi:uncharacterized protein YuzE
MPSSVTGSQTMQILYDEKKDLLYFRLDDSKQNLINQRIADNIVLDIGKDDRIVGIEILDASRHLNLKSLLPVKYEISSKA